MLELSPWGRRLIAGLTVGLALAAVRLWVGVFYLGTPVNTILVWRAEDKPALPPSEYQPEALLGVHYFGDFQEGLSWGALIVERSASPYDLMVTYLPAAVWPFAALASLPTQAAFAIYLSAMALGILVPIWLMTAMIRTSERIMVLCLLGVLTVPFIGTMDRGNLQGVVIAAIGFALWAASTKRWRLMACLLVLAICLKGYPIFLLIVPIAYGKWRLAALITLSAGAISGVLFALMPGGIAHNVSNYVTALRSFGGMSIPDYNYSFVGALQQAAAVPVGDSLAAGLARQPGLSLLIAAAWLLLIWILIVGGRVPQWCWGPLALASLQVITPISYAYSLTWAGLAGVWFLRGELIPNPPARVGRSPEALSPSQEVFLRILTMSALMVTLVPMGLAVTTGEVTTTLAPLLSPVAIAATGVAALTLTLKRPRALSKR